MVGMVAVHVNVMKTEHLLSAERRRNACISSKKADGAAPLSDVAEMRLRGGDDALCREEKKGEDDGGKMKKGYKCRGVYGR